MAVPAQREAGVLKGFENRKPCLKELAAEFGAQAEYRILWKQAELGRQYEKELQDQVVRLSLSLNLGVEEPVLRGMVQKAAPEDLLKLRDALEKRLAQWLPVQPQLPGTAQILETVENDYLI